MFGTSPDDGENDLSATGTSIEGLVKLKRPEHKDSRGSFSRLFNQQDLAAVGWPAKTEQVNFSVTERMGTVRGMHAQTGETPEYKLVTCVKGTIWDVAVDLRKDSKTFLGWEAFELSEANNCSLLVPPGVAHGFQTLTDDVELVYCHSAPYVPGSGIGINPFDEVLAISWPLSVTDISAQDRGHQALPLTFEGLSE